MSDAHWIVAAIAMVVALCFSVGSTGYNATTAGRAVAVAVVGDADASLALSYASESVSIEPNTQETLVSVRNQFSQPVEVRVTAVVEAKRGLSVEVPTVETRSLSPGEGFAVPMMVRCLGTEQADPSTTVRFDVRAEGETIAVETAESRTVTYSVACPSQTEPADGSENR